MKKKVTSTDIAKEAGVSQATVPKVFNKKYNVTFSKETITKLEEEAKRVGYTIPKSKSKKGRKKGR